MKPTRQIIFKTADWDRMTRYFAQNSSVESGAYAIFRSSGDGGWEKYLVCTLLLPIDADYHRRTATSVAFTPGLTETAFQISERLRANLIDIHTHPWAHRVDFSSIDDHETLSRKVPYITRYLPGLRLAFIVLGMSPEIARARIWDGSRSRLEPIDRITLV